MGVRWRLGLGLAGLGVAVGVTALGVETGRRWRELRAELDRQRAAASAREGQRPVLVGTPLPGNAWVHYVRAIEGFEALQVETHGLMNWLRPDERLRPAQWRDLLAGTEAPVEHLRCGARSTRVVRPSEGPDGETAAHLRLLTAMGLARLAAAHGELLRSERHSDAAVELLLDVLQMGRDLGRDGDLSSEMIGEAAQSIALERLADVLRSGELSRAEAERLAGLLACFHEAPPERHGLRNELLAIADAPLDHPRVGRAFDGHGRLLVRLSAWRTGFSMRLLVLELCEKAARVTERLAHLHDLSWSEAAPLLDELGDEIHSDPNLLVRLALGSLESSERSWRQSEAHLRLVRAAAEQRAGHAPRPWPDPFGDELRRAEREGTRVLWSRGWNGLDDGGQGFFESGHDLVLRLEPAGAR